MHPSSLVIRLSTQGRFFRMISILKTYFSLKVSITLHDRASIKYDPLAMLLSKVHNQSYVFDCYFVVFTAVVWSSKREDLNQILIETLFTVFFAGMKTGLRPVCGVYLCVCT